MQVKKDPTASFEVKKTANLFRLWCPLPRVFGGAQGGPLRKKMRLKWAVSSFRTHTRANVDALETSNENPPGLFIHRQQADSTTS